MLDYKFEKSTANQHIYITSDEEIKEGDWIFNFEYNYIVHDSKKYDDKFWYKKIILTTDQDLIKDGIQAIDDDFLEWFVKNPSCESVEVQKWASLAECGYSYHITIPQEEPKQETLEEAAEKHSELQAGTFTPPHKTTYKHGFEDGAKWQAERMYSEEDLKEAFKSCYTPFGFDRIGDLEQDFNKWFEQFKKK